MSWAASVHVDGGEVTRWYDVPEEGHEAVAEALIRKEELGNDSVVTLVFAPRETDEDRKAATEEFFQRISDGDAKAIEEAIYLIRVHALPEDHPLALD